MSINICKHFLDVTTLNLGGGYKVGRMSYEADKSTNLQTCGDTAIDTPSCTLFTTLFTTLLKPIYALQPSVGPAGTPPNPNPNPNPNPAGTPVKEAMVAFAKETGRELHLEIEPGTYLLANACSLVSRVQDKVATTTTPPAEFAAVAAAGAAADEKGAAGYTFLKLDSGMTEVLRPSLYAAQHPVVIVPMDDAR